MGEREREGGGERERGRERAFKYINALLILLFILAPSVWWSWQLMCLDTLDTKIMVGCHYSNFICMIMNTVPLPSQS